MSLLRKILLFPFALIWDLVTRLRNSFYDNDVFTSQAFDLPVIGVGNLSMGGTGKTPHVEYLVRILQDNHNPSILSRGYKRSTNGYIFASTQSTVKQIGDEPLQYKIKHPHIPVAVSESRVLGIPQLLIDAPDISVVLLDDVFQHRSVSPGLNILLTDYNNRYTNDMVFPSGSLRETKSGAKRANIIIVTKCPANLSQEEADKIVTEIKPEEHQTVYFSHFHYGQPYSFLERGEFFEGGDPEVIIATGIAKPKYLQNYLNSTFTKTYRVDYQDHHHFTERDIYNLQRIYENLGDVEKVIFITEKDAVKLVSFAKLIRELNLPIYVQPIQVGILLNQGNQLNQELINFVENF